MKKILNIMTVLLLAATCMAAGYTAARYGTPIIVKEVKANYADPNTPLPSIINIQTLLVAKGYDIGSWGIDGELPGDETEGPCTEAAWKRAFCDQCAVAVWPKKGGQQ